MCVLCLLHHPSFLGFDECSTLWMDLVSLLSSFNSNIRQRTKYQTEKTQLTPYNNDAVTTIQVCVPLNISSEVEHAMKLLADLSYLWILIQ